MSLAVTALIQAVDLPAAAAPLYTCPASQMVLVKHVVFTNHTSGSINVTAYIVPAGGSASAAAQILSAFAIAGNTAYTSPEFCGIVLKTGDSIQCFASSAASVGMNANGIVQS